MSGFEIGIASFAILMLLILLRAPIGLAMFGLGCIGTYLLMDSWLIPLNRLKTEVYTQFSSYSLSIVPLFLLMGQFAAVSGLSARLFRACETWLGHRRGGVAMAAIGSCAGFGSICGSSLATAATMGKVALPELRRCGYSGGFASATLAAGGTLGILIPPSVILVIYAILTEQNISKLFLAALIPGLLAALGYMAVIRIYVSIFPEHTEVAPPQPWRVRCRALIDVWPVLTVFLVVVGGIYLGVFSPTDGASLGAAGMFGFALHSGNLNWQTFKTAIFETAKASAMIFFIILGAAIYNGFLALTQVPQELAFWIGQQGFSPWAILALILLVYLVMGCVMDSLSMILLTIPIVFPLISGLDFGLSAEHTAIWFGILVLMTVEVGLITPPVGMNLFILRSMAPDTPLIETYKSVSYFVISDILRILLLAACPIITLFLL